MNKFVEKEKAVAKFLGVLIQSGMQHSFGNELNAYGKLKPKFFRLIVSSDGQKQPIFLRYQVTDDSEAMAADNGSWLRTTFIDGLLFSKNGFDDEEYQKLSAMLSEKFDEAGISFNFVDDGLDTALDQDNGIYFIKFAARVTQ